MYFEIILTLIIIQNLRKTLRTAGSYPVWDKLFVAGFILTIVLLVLQVSVHGSRPITMWVIYAILISLAYVTLTKKEFLSKKSLMNAVLPYIIVTFTENLIKLISYNFYDQLDDFFGPAKFFAVIWMIAMWFITKKQRKALETERLRTLEIEKENRITESLKAALEVQVAERTAALTQQKEELQQALDVLKSTQTQLIQSEKMASLGELTAGIAHEIQNPLNFVNNFSEVNTELIGELEQEIEKGNFKEVKAIAKDIAVNEQKINHHGKRADAIVKGMLQHSRSSSGVKEPTNINALADEYLRLAYHGLRAKDKTFNATMKTDFDESIKSINIIPQDIGRVILNLITNAFYAVTEKKKSSPPAGGETENSLKEYEPTVIVKTSWSAPPAGGGRKAGVSVSIKDNGNGIPQKALDKIFQPFFTTKPTGHGTGLGLSMSYDIVTKGHGGELKVLTKEGEGAEFIIQLPVA